MLEDQNLTALAALPTPLPPPLDDQIFTQEQWTTFLSLTEVFVPSISRSNVSQAAFEKALNEIQEILPQETGVEIIEQYLAETVANNDEFKEAVRQRFARHIPKPQSAGLAFLMSALNTRLGSLAMTGSTVPIHTRDLETRTKIVFGWARSYLGPLRAVYQAMDFIARATWLGQSKTMHQVIDYPQIPKDIERHPSYDFKFIDFATEPETEVVQVDADVVIVGSGCGAGVVADHLSSKLMINGSKPRILVLEKGYHYPSSHFPMDSTAAGEHLNESGGGVLSDDGSIAVLAGSTWGGGGTINWSASLQPQSFVRQEWARKDRLDFALTQEFQSELDYVCDRMGVCRLTDAVGLSKIEHNFGNQTLLEASRRLGLTTEIVPQNTAGKRHYCGRCHMGCGSTTKQGPANLWLPSAAENGCEFVEGCIVEKIIWDETVPKSKKARGVSAIWTSRDRKLVRNLRINASIVVISSGTLHTPLVLHRSGLTPEYNRHIGSNLHLHPVLSTRGVYKERVDPWDGAILTTAMCSLENFDHKGHGPKIEVMLGTPDLTMTVMPFRTDYSLNALSSKSSEPVLKSALEYKVSAAKHGHSFVLISIQRDHADELNLKKSYVYGDPSNPRIVKVNYRTSAKDREGLLEGALTSARMHFVMGAQSIEINSPDIPIFVRRNDSNSADADFEAWINSIRKRGIAAIDPTSTRFGSAHQMGTCRMSSRVEDGAVDPKGKVWGTENVFVADASILPSASGVNPMVTNMGLSLRVAKAIVAQFAA